MPEIGVAFGDSAGSVDEQPARTLKQRANCTQEQRILKTSSCDTYPAFVGKARYLPFLYALYAPRANVRKGFRFLPSLQDRMDSFRALAVGVLVVLLSACGGPGGSAGAISPPQSAGTVARSARSGGSDIIYVNDEIYSNTITVYGGRNRNLLRTITNGLDEPDSLALDRSGHLYVSNDGVRDYKVNVYGNQGAKLVRTVSRNLSSTDQVALDSLGNLYVLDKRGIAVYANGKSRAMHRINTRYGTTIAIDALNNLYVVLATNKVEVYPLGSKTPSRTISDGIFDAISVAVDSHGYVYVANVFGGTGYCGKFSHGGDVTVYAPGNDAPIYTLTPSDGICFPGRLALDASDDLYVANGPPGTEIPGSITVYAPGGTLLRTITQGINAPDALALDPDGYLYVANAYANTVTVYAPGTTSVSQTLSNGVSYPISLAIGR